MKFKSNFENCLIYVWLHLPVEGLTFIYSTASFHLQHLHLHVQFFMLSCMSEVDGYWCDLSTLACECVGGLPGVRFLLVQTCSRSSDSHRPQHSGLISYACEKNAKQKGVNEYWLEEYTSGRGSQLPEVHPNIHWCIIILDISLCVLTMVEDLWGQRI